jgi:hypothetical protein
MHRTGEDTCGGHFGQAKGLIKQHDKAAYRALPLYDLRPRPDLLRCPDRWFRPAEDGQRRLLPGVIGIKQSGANTKINRGKRLPCPKIEADFTGYP